MSSEPLDLRGRDLDINGVLKAIRDYTLTTREDPTSVIISPAQEASFIAEWEAANVSEPPPPSLDGRRLWGQRVVVQSSDSNKTFVDVAGQTITVGRPPEDYLVVADTNARTILVSKELLADPKAGKIVLERLNADASITDHDAERQDDNQKAKG